MGVTRYEMKSRVYWSVDEWLPLADGRLVRYRKRKIPTKEQALALVAKKRAEAFEGRFFDRPKESKLTVKQAWDDFEPIAVRDNKSWKDQVALMKPVLAELGKWPAKGLTLG